ncbi:methyltransferase [Weeksellaceae bacterium A-14]
MKPFVFKHFTIAQHPEVFRVGTDGVLLGALADAGNAKRILEVGAGTGLVSLMLAQRNRNADVFAVEISPAAAELAGHNFRNSPFYARMKVFQEDFKNFSSPDLFDLIVSNPPYFEENTSVKHVLARQKRELDFTALIRKSSELITPQGALSVIIPADQSADFIAISEENGFHLIHKINILGIADGVVKRQILRFSKKKSVPAEVDLIIEKSPGKFTDHYLELTKDFHVFGGK